MIEFLTALLVGITGFYAWVTFKIMRANEHTVAAMRQQYDAMLRPYVVISLATPPNSVLFYLRIANTGKTGAEKVRLQMDRDFYQYGQKDKPNLRTVAAFQEPIDQLPPGTEISFALAQGFVILGTTADPALTPQVFTVTATYSYGDKTVTERTTIDLRPFVHAWRLPDPLVDEVKKIRETGLVEIARQLQQLVANIGRNDSGSGEKDS